ncbi:MAG: hypothetical protein HEQ33_05265 [Dolichospermum sp. WA123]|nr:hypothetical protein [Dolichospermum sp. WA123]
MSEKKQSGIPLYIDQSDRVLVDTVSAYQPNEWYPANGCATRLLKCREALQDIYEILDSYSGINENETDRRRRKLRSISVPLHSLCVAICHLIDQIQSEKQIHNQLPKGTTVELNKLRTKFVQLIPFDRKGKLGSIRNKLAAHYEKDMSLTEMRQLDQDINSTEIGEWLHISIAMLCDLMKLEAYVWWANGPVDSTAIFMFQYPGMTVFEIVDQKVVSIKAVLLCTKDPRNIIFEILEKVTQESHMLFEHDSSFRILGFTPDDPTKWNRTVQLIGST